MNDIMEMIENMTEEQRTELLNQEFDADLEKQASAEVAKAGLAEALYAYGAFLADREVESTEELSKEAAEEFDAAHVEITSAIEQGLEESGLLDSEDTAELHKEAQAAAALIFQGYTEQLEKVAGMKDKLGRLGKMVANKAKAVKASGKKAGKQALKFGKKHKKGLMVGGAAAAAAGGALAYRKSKMEKKAGELSSEDIRQIYAEEQEHLMIDDVVMDGVEKLAAAAMGKGLKSTISKALKTVKTQASGVVGAAKTKGQAAGKYVMKNKKSMALGAAAGLGAGVAAGRASKKD